VPEDPDIYTAAVCQMFLPVLKESLKRANILMSIKSNSPWQFKKTEVLQKSFDSRGLESFKLLPCWGWFFGKCLHCFTSSCYFYL